MSKRGSRLVQEPVERAGGLTGDGRIFTHPTYGQISAHRVQGIGVLYGSDFLHNGYVTISIARSELHRDLSHDWPFQRAEIIEVALSEAQWATFVSSLNVGGGTQCTIQRLEGALIPGLPEPQDTTGQFMDESRAVLDDAVRALDDLLALIASPELTISAKARGKLLGAAQSAALHLRGSLPFVAKSFGEHMQRRAEKAKIEVMAWMHRTIQRTGLDALVRERPPLELPPADREP